MVVSDLFTFLQNQIKMQMQLKKQARQLSKPRERSFFIGSRDGLEDFGNFSEYMA